MKHKMLDTPRYAWLWVSPNGRIKHTYTPKTLLVQRLYHSRGWTNPRTVAKGEAQ